MDFFRTIKDSKIVGHATKVMGLIVAIVAACVGTIEWFDSHYVRAETAKEILKVVKSQQMQLNSIETRMDLNLIRDEMSFVKSEMREYRKEYGFNLKRASDFEKGQYNDLKDKLKNSQDTYNSILKSKKSVKELSE